MPLKFNPSKKAKSGHFLFICTFRNNKREGKCAKSYYFPFLRLLKMRFKNRFGKEGGAEFFLSHSFERTLLSHSGQTCRPSGISFPHITQRSQSKT